MLTEASYTDNVDDEVARDSGVVSRVADDVVGPGNELWVTLDTTDVRQLTTTSTNEHRRRPRHVTRPS